MLDKAEEASRSAPKRKRRVVGMRRRWIMGSVLPVIVILLLIAALTSVILVTNFYSNARSALESKARSGVSYFNTYVMVSYNEYYRNAVLYAKDFEDADTIELQFLDKNGRIDEVARLIGVSSDQQASGFAHARALLNAGAEVNNALTQCQSARAKADLRVQQIEALERAVESTELLMKHSSTTYLEVLTAQQSLLSAQLSQIADRFDEIQGVVNLYQALGGGRDMAEEAK